MAVKAPLRVHQTTTTTGTGTYSLTAANGANRNFSDSYATAALVPYCVTDFTGNYEIGIGTLTTPGSPDTIARTSVLLSSNGNAAVSWASGAKDIFAYEAATALYDADFAANKTADASDWGNISTYTGAGGNTFTLPPLTTVPLGYTTGAANAGTGPLAIAKDAGDTWRNTAPANLQPGGTLQFVASPNGWITIRFGGFSAGVGSAGNTAGTTGLVTNQLVLVGDSNITLSQSTNSAGATVSVQAGGGGATLSEWSVEQIGASTTTAYGTQTLSITPIVIPQALSFCRIERGCSNGADFLGVVSTYPNCTNQKGVTYQIGLYSQGTGAGSTGLSLITSASATFGASYQLSISTNGASWSLSMLGTARHASAIDLTGGMTESTRTASTFSSFPGAGTLNGGFVGAQRCYYEVPLATSLAAGNYFVGELVLSTTQSTGGWPTGLNGFTYPGFSNLLLGTNSAAGPLGFQVTNTAHPFMPGSGTYTLTTTGFPAAIGLTDIAAVSRLDKPELAFVNATL